MSGHEFGVRRSAFGVPPIVHPDEPLRLRLTCEIELDPRLLPLVAAAGTLMNLLHEHLAARKERHP